MVAGEQFISKFRSKNWNGSIAPRLKSCSEGKLELWYWAKKVLWVGKRNKIE